MHWLEGKVVLVTGGASGIGRSIVRRFIEEKARVCVLDLSKEKLQSLETEFANRVVAVHGDVRSFTDNQRAVTAAVDAYGKLDVFVGNAGVFDGFTKFKEVTSDALGDAFNDIFSINVQGYIYGAKAALTELIKTRGNIIFTVSQASFYPDGGGVLYTASKHAALGVIRQLAFELAPDIRVNGVAPGGTITDLFVPESLRPYVKPVDNEEKKRRIAQRNPLRMAMDPEDHMGAYVLLASDQAKAITGEVISSDGGLDIRGMS